MVLGLEVKVFHSVEEIGRDSIDSISDDPFFTYGWLRTTETHSPFKVCPLYLTVFDEKKLVAFAQFTIKSLKPSNFLPHFPKFLDGIFGLKVLLSESPCCWRSKVLLSKNIDQKKILDLLDQKINDICKKHKIQYTNFSFVSQHDKLIIESFQSRGYSRHPALTTLNIDVYWSCFQEYLQSLKKTARRNARREIRNCILNGIIIEEAQLENLFEKVAELNSNLFLKYKNTANIFDADFFRTLNENARDKITLFIAKKNNEVVGFFLSLRQKEVADFVMCGFNYDVKTKKDFTYFNLCYYVPIEWSIKHGVRKMYYRIMQEQVKINRGCKPEKNYSFTKWHNPLLGTLANKVYYPLHDRGFLKVQ
jgi:predicted N-acyltransferase